MLGILLILAVAWLVVRIRKNKAAELPAPVALSETGSFHAVAIKYSENACNAAKALTGRRFLSTAAPRLPLPDCNYPDCRCMFAHYDDRRTDSDRRSPFASGGNSGTTGAFESERRQQAERRQDRSDDDLTE